VKHVHPNSAAALGGLASGDRILSLNGNGMVVLSNQAGIDAIKAAAEQLQMLVLRGNTADLDDVIPYLQKKMTPPIRSHLRPLSLPLFGPRALNYQTEGPILSLYPRYHAESFGCEFIGGADSTYGGLFVSNETSDRSGLRAGDRLLEVKGRSVLELSLQELWDIIGGEHESPVLFVVQRLGLDVMRRLEELVAEIDAPKSEEVQSTVSVPVEPSFHGFAIDTPQTPTPLDRAPVIAVSPAALSQPSSSSMDKNAFAEEMLQPPSPAAARMTIKAFQTQLSVDSIQPSPRAVSQAENTPKSDFDSFVEPPSPSIAVTEIAHLKTPMSSSSIAQSPETLNEFLDSDSDFDSETELDIYAIKGTYTEEVVTGSAVCRQHDPVQERPRIVSTLQSSQKHTEKAVQLDVIQGEGDEEALFEMDNLSILSDISGLYVIKGGMPVYEAEQPQSAIAREHVALGSKPMAKVAQESGPEVYSAQIDPILTHDDDEVEERPTAALLQQPHTVQTTHDGVSPIQPLQKNPVHTADHKNSAPVSLSSSITPSPSFSRLGSVHASGHHKQLVPEDEDVRIVTLYRVNGSFGVTVFTPDAIIKTPVYIGEVKSPDAIASGLRRGDRLLSLNGLDVRYTSCDKIKALISNVGRSIVLKVLHDPAMENYKSAFTAPVKPNQTGAAQTMSAHVCYSSLCAHVCLIFRVVGQRSCAADLVSHRESFFRSKDARSDPPRHVSLNFWSCCLQPPFKERQLYHTCHTWRSRASNGACVCR
jgi:membrane-associated protease RseP (regulator of RpoE activity)